MSILRNGHVALSVGSCGSVYYISHVISISNSRLLSFLVLIIWRFEIFNLFDPD